MRFKRIWVGCSRQSCVFLCFYLCLQLCLHLRSHLRPAGRQGQGRAVLGPNHARGEVAGSPTLIFARLWPQSPVP